MKRRVGKFVFEEIKKLIEKPAFTELCRMSAKELIRNRKITVPELVTTILRGARRDIHTAMFEMRNSKEVKTKSYSEAAFCKARRKINFTAFKTLFEYAAQLFFEAADEPLKFVGKYRVWAIDGSKINLPTNPETLEEFGSEAFNHGYRAQGLASCLYDTLNKISLDATLERFDANERTLAEAHFQYLDEYCKKQGWNHKFELITLDRGYPSESIFQTLLDKGFSFVARVNKNNFWKELRDVKENDTIISRGSITVRVVQVPLKKPEVTESGEVVTVATLITNLSENEMSRECIAELYRLRWCIETNYDYLKNRIELENFTGLSPLCIRQDFYAALFLSNLVACSEYDSAPQIKKYNKGTKLDYKPNFTELYRQLHRDLYTLVLTDSSRQRDLALKRINDEIMATLIPIRPNRNPSRGKPARAPKFYHNHKPS